MLPVTLWLWGLVGLAGRVGASDLSETICARSLVVRNLIDRDLFIERSDPGDFVAADVAALANALQILRVSKYETPRHDPKDLVKQMIHLDQRPIEARDYSPAKSLDRALLLAESMVQDRGIQIATLALSREPFPIRRPELVAVERFSLKDFDESDAVLVFAGDDVNAGYQRSKRASMVLVGRINSTFLVFNAGRGDMKFERLEPGIFERSGGVGFFKFDYVDRHSKAQHFVPTSVTRFKFRPIAIRTHALDPALPGDTECKLENLNVCFLVDKSLHQIWRRQDGRYGILTDQMEANFVELVGVRKRRDGLDVHFKTPLHVKVADPNQIRAEVTYDIHLFLKISRVTGHGTVEQYLKEPRDGIFYEWPGASGLNRHLGYVIRSDYKLTDK